MGVAVRGVYNLTEDIKNALLADENVNTVTFGDITRINLEKQDIYPISHLNLGQVQDEENILIFTISLLSFDVVDVNKNPTEDIFIRNDNEQDILNTQLAVQVKLIKDLRQSSLNDRGYNINGTPVHEPFTDRFGAEVAGWGLSFDVEIANDISIC